MGLPTTVLVYSDSVISLQTLQVQKNHSVRKTKHTMTCIHAIIFSVRFYGKQTTQMKKSCPLSQLIFCRVATNWQLPFVYCVHAVAFLTVNLGIK